MLTKKDKKKRYNKSVKSRGHSFAGTWTTNTQEAFDENLGGAVGGLVGAASAGIQAGIQNAELQGVEEAQAGIDARKNFTSAASTNNDLLAEMASATNTKADFDFKDFMQDGKTLAMNTLNATMQGAASGASAGPWGAVAGAAAGLLGGVGGIIGGRVKAGVEAAKKKEAARRANMAQAQALASKAGALDQAADARSLAAYYADGGMINPFPSSQFGSPITEFNAGGSHEENPYDGIPQGIAPDGLPNLVEEGEVKYDNYIFSDRLMLNKNDKKKYKFLKGKTYADAAKAIKRELGIDERPNDLIAKTDLEEQLNLLSTLQEEERAKRGLKGENRMMYAKGGHLFRGDWTQEQLTGVKNATQNTSFANWFGSDAFKQSEYSSLGRKDARNLYNTAHGITGFDWSSTLQAAPAMGSAIGLISNLFDKPSYEHTKKLTQPEEAVTPITYTPTHQDIRLDRFDTNYHANKLAAQAGATRRAIREKTASNPYATTAALLSADANAQSHLGDLYRKAAEYNQGVALQEAQFNSTGRRSDAEGLLKAASANATLQDKALSRQAEKDIYAARLNIAEDQAWDTANSATMTSLFDNLGAMGKEDQEFALAAMKMMEEGKLTKEMQAMLLPKLQKILAEAGYRYGGKLRKKKGYTI